MGSLNQFDNHSQLKTSCKGWPSTSAILKAHSKLGEYLPASMAAMVWRVTPTCSPKSDCVISLAKKRNVLTLFVKRRLSMDSFAIAVNRDATVDHLCHHNEEK